MDIKALFGTNQTKEKEGSFMELGEGSGIRIRRSNYQPYKIAVEAALRKNNQMQRMRRLSTVEFMEKFNPDLVAQYLVTELIDLVDEGTPVEPGIASCKKLFKKYPDLYTAVFMFAETPENYKDEELEEIEGK